MYAILLFNLLNRGSCFCDTLIVEDIFEHVNIYMLYILNILYYNISLYIIYIC